MTAAKKVWKIAWRIGVCLLLLAWIFQAIFYDEGKQAWLEMGKDWQALTRLERFQIALKYGPPGIWDTLKSMAPGPLLLSLVLMGATIFAGVVRWQIVLKVHGLGMPLGRTTPAAQSHNPYHMKTLTLKLTPSSTRRAKPSLAERTATWFQGPVARLVLSVGLCLAAPWAVAAAPALLSIAADHTPVAAGEAFSLTVTYDKAMDTAINPAITFPTSGEDAAPFLSATTAVWINGTTFRQSYQAQYVSLNLSTVDAAVDGAKDTLGTAQQAGFQADVFDVVMYIPPPQVVDILGDVQPGAMFVNLANNGHVITAADVGKTVEFFVRYTRATDYGGCGTTANNYPCPDFAFTNIGGTPLSLTNVSAQWQSRTLYKVTWTIADGDEQFASIDVKVAGGVGRRDDSNIKSSDFVASGLFSIDTKHPTVTGISAGTASITSTSPASGLVTLTATYSHAMDTTSTPSFSFPNQAIGSALTPTTGAWTDSTHYAQTFRVSGTGISFASVDVKVSGARKATSGNLQREGTVVGVFGINLPVPAPTFGGLTPLIINVPGVTLVPGTLLDASCCGDIFVRVLSKALNTPLTLVGYTGTGTVVLDGYQGGRLAFLVNAVATGDVRDEGVYAMGDGRYQVVSGGIAATIVPAVVDIAQLASLLPQGSSIQMSANGVLSATIDGLVYVVQAGVGVQRVVNADGRPGIAKANDGYLHFTDTSGNQQILYPAFLEPQTLLNYLRAIDPAASLSIQLDGTARVVLQGKAYDVVPELTLHATPSGLPGQGWLQDAAQHYLFLNQQRANTVQGLDLSTNK